MHRDAPVSNREWLHSDAIQRLLTTEQNDRRQVLIQIELDRLRLLRELLEEDRRGSGFFKLGGY